MKQEIKKNTLLFSVGPHQVITQYILVKQKNLDDKVIGVLRTRSMTDGEIINKDLEKCEDYIHNILGLTQIAHLDSIYKLWGKNKYEKFLNLPFLKRKIREELSATKLELNNVENIILTARYDLGEILLLSAFKNLKNIYFVSDGNPYLYKINKIKNIPFYLTLFKFKNPYQNYPEVFFYKDNLPAQYYNIKPQELRISINNSVNTVFMKDRTLTLWLEDIFEKSSNEAFSIVFLQPLESFPSLSVNIDLYKRIVRSELKKGNNTIIFKHHPREKKDILVEFKENLKSEFEEKVNFFNDHYLSRLPFEIYYKMLNVNRVIAVFTTSVLFIKDSSIVFYSSNILPQKYIEMTEFLAKKLNQEVNYV